MLRCSLPSSEIQSRYSKGTHLEADESTKIMFMPMSSMTSLPMEHSDMWREMAPSAKGCISLYVRLAATMADLPLAP